jgi:hypothetical protein
MSDPGKPVKRLLDPLDTPEGKKDRRVAWAETNKDGHLPGSLKCKDGRQVHLDSELVVTNMVGWRTLGGRPASSILVLDHVGPTCPSALAVMKIGDLLVGKIAVHLDDFVDIVALSRVCLASRRALTMKHPDFAAFRMALAPFDKPHSPNDWKRRACDLIARNCAFSFFRFLGERLPMDSRRLDYATTVMKTVLVSRVGVSLTDDHRERVLAFCENAFRWSWAMLQNVFAENGVHRRQAAVVVSNPNLAVELFRRVNKNDAYLFAARSAIKAAIYQGVPLPVFRELFELVHDEKDPLIANEKAHQCAMLSRTVFSPNPELLVYALDRVKRTSPIDMGMFIDRLAGRRRMPNQGENTTVKHFVAPATLDVLNEHGIINLAGPNGLRLTVLYMNLVEEVKVITNSANLKRCQEEIEWFKTNLGAKKQ